MLKHERVVAELSQLNDRVHQSLRSTLSLFALLGTIREKNTLALHMPANSTPFSTNYIKM
jgi:hypothetical protein